LDIYQVYTIVYNPQAKRTSLGERSARRCGQALEGREVRGSRIGLPRMQRKMKYRGGSTQ